MAHSLSAKKRHRQNIKRRSLNRWHKTRYRRAINDYHEAILHAPVEEAERKLSGLYQLLDHVAAKGAIHRNTASRYKSRLAERLNRKKSHAT